MKIKTKLKLIIIVNILILVGIVSLSLLWQKQADKQFKQQTLVMKLNLAIFERARSREEYFIYGSDRSKEQFLLIHKKVGELLAGMSGTFTGSGEKVHLNNMTGFHTKIGNLFSRVVRLNESAMGNAAATQALRQRIISQMLVNAHSMYRETSNLLQLANEKTVHQINLARLYSHIFFGLLALFIVYFTVIILISVTHPLARLHEGTEIIARGDLDYKTNIRTPDEVGQLSTAFDLMTEKLKKITVSRYELSKEVEMRVMAEDTLRALTSRQEAILAAVPEIIMEVDNNKVYTWANSTGIEFFGEDVIGKEASFYFEGEQDTYDKVNPLFNGAEDMIYVESWQRRKDGQKRLLGWWCRVLKDEDGNITGVLSSARDITERKQAEEEIQRLNAELEQRVIDRTIQLEAANRELEAFSYSVSHDLRAPLRTIDGFSQALLEEYEDKPLDNIGMTYLERVRRATQHMGWLIDDLLKLSRITQSEFHRESVALSCMVRAIAETHQKNNPDRVIDVTVQEGIMVQGDPYLMRIALENLMANSWKFTGKEAHPRIEFGTTVRDGKTACFIRDNGAGFDMAYVGKLFGAFQRLHTTDEFPGTGIGLATVQRIIHRHGGRAWAEGETGKGATFYFTVPS